MAYIDQDNSRGKAFSGAIAIVVVGAVGYALVCGLAINVWREPAGLIPGASYRAPPPPPPPRQLAQPRAAHPTPSQSTTIPPVAPVHPDLAPTPIDLGRTPTVIDLGPGLPGTGSGPGLPLQPPQPPADQSARAMPKGHPGDWVSNDAYPPAAARAGLEGRSGFRLDIGVDGRATDCTIVSSSGSDELDRTACRELLRNARFSPAKDVGGHPTATSYTGTVTWKLPAD